MHHVEPEAPADGLARPRATRSSRCEALRDGETAERHAKIDRHPRAVLDAATSRSRR